MYNKTPISLLCSKAISGTKDERPNIITKDVPIRLSPEEVPRVLGTVIQKPRQKTKIYTCYKLQYHMLSVENIKSHSFLCNLSV